MSRASVARKHGVAAVVDVTAVALALRSGKRERVDGSRGTVERPDAHE